MFVMATCSSRQMLETSEVARQHAQHLLGLAGVAHDVHSGHILMFPPASIACSSGSALHQFQGILIEAALPHPPQCRCLSLQPAKEIL